MKTKATLIGILIVIAAVVLVFRIADAITFLFPWICPKVAILIMVVIYIILLIAIYFIKVRGKNAGKSVK